jgi:putative hydrolase of the HAD superfamily
MKSKTKYNHLFFDLDRTLWDFDTNSEETLRQLYKQYTLSDKGIFSFDDFHEVYKVVNADMWEKYRNGQMDKATLSHNRFHLTLMEFGIDDGNLADAISAGYVYGISEKTRLFPFVRETLDHLYGRYRMHVLTNGFMEVQYRKMENTGLGKYFENIITSEEAGAHKPALRIFEFALEKTGASARESLMIGDDPLVDMVGAKSAGMDQMFVNYEGKEVSELFTYTIRSLEEIKGIL